MNLCPPAPCWGLRTPIPHGSISSHSFASELQKKNYSVVFHAGIVFCFFISRRRTKSGFLDRVYAKIKIENRKGGRSMEAEEKELLDEDLVDELLADGEILCDDIEFDDDPDNSDCIPVLYFLNSDPYYRAERTANGHIRHNIRFDEEGHIIVRNPSAYWLPGIKIDEEIDGTVYTVTGSYEGTETLDQKLSRIMLHNLEDF
jgi:plasmid stability protein